MTTSIGKFLTLAIIVGAALLGVTGVRGNAENPIFLFSYDTSRSEAEARSTLRVEWSPAPFEVLVDSFSYVGAVRHDLQVEINKKIVLFPDMLFIAVSTVGGNHENITDGPNRVTLEEAVRLAHQLSDLIEKAGWVRGTQLYDDPLTVVPLIANLGIKKCKSYAEFQDAFLSIRGFQRERSSKYEREARINSTVGVWRDRDASISVQIQARPDMGTGSVDLANERIYFINISIFPETKGMSRKPGSNP